jgi:hypothetical protein
MTGLPSICDDFGTTDLAVRVQAYHPGWYVTWNQVEDDKMDVLAPSYHLQRITAFPAFDDPERNLLILYRLDSATPAKPTPSRRKPTIPHMIRTSFVSHPIPRSSTTSLPPIFPLSAVNSTNWGITWPPVSSYHAKNECPHL